MSVARSKFRAESSRGLCRRKLSWECRGVHLTQRAGEGHCAYSCGCSLCSYCLRRCIITDHGAFVLFNVYCPLAYGDAGDDDTRFRYKSAFQSALAARARHLVSQGRSGSASAAVVCGLRVSSNLGADAYSLLAI